MAKQCRTCLTLTADEYMDMVSPLTTEGKTIVECFNVCTRLGASLEEEELPLTMCMPCVQNLLVAYNFWQIASNADASLRSGIRVLKIVESGSDIGIEDTEETVLLCPKIESTETVDEVHMEEVTLEVECIDEEKPVIQEDDSVDSEDELEFMNNEAFELDDSIEGMASNVISIAEDSNDRQILRIKQRMAELNPNADTESDEMYLIEYKEGDNDNENNEQYDLMDVNTKWKCQECYRVLRGDVSYEGHMNWHKGVRPYKCVLCRRTFRCKFALEYHVETIHGDGIVALDFACLVCKQGFQSQTDLEEHQIADHQFANCAYCPKIFDAPTLELHTNLVHSPPSLPVECPYCSQSPLPRQKLAEHFRIDHPVEYRTHFSLKERNRNEVTSWQCEICHLWIHSRNFYTRHMRAHTGAYKCRVCGKMITSSYSLRCHMRSKHPHEYNKIENYGKREVQCKICMKIYLRKNLKRHLQLMHMGKNNQLTCAFQCTCCSFECENQKALDEHLQTNHAESNGVYNCTDCDRSYNSQNLLICHRKVAHKKANTACSICGNVYKSKAQLFGHMRLHLGKDIPCPQCDKKFAFQSELRGHLLTHTGEKPFACHLCDKRYLKKVSLTYHLQKHEGTMHPCSYCSVVCDTRAKLREHMFEHSSKPYICEICPKVQLSRRLRFMNHMLRVHDKQMTEDELADMFAKNTGRVIKFKTISN